MATVIRNIHGETFTLEERPDAARSALEGDGVLVICQRPKIDVLPNSVNEVQAREVWGNLGFTTWEFVKKEIVMSADVGRVLFLLHAGYVMGTSKLFLPIPGFAARLRPYPKAFVATLVGGAPELEFFINVNSTRGEVKTLTVNGGDTIVWTNGVERTIPQTNGGTAFVSETFYYPPTVVAERLEEYLLNDYRKEGGEELELDEAGNLVWSQQKFMEHRKS